MVILGATGKGGQGDLMGVAIEHAQQDRASQMEASLGGRMAAEWVNSVWQREGKECAIA